MRAQLVVIEAKKSEAAVKADGAEKQAAAYVEQLTAHAEELFAFFNQLAQSLARIYCGGEILRIDPTRRARWEVWWPEDIIVGPMDDA